MSMACAARGALLFVTNHCRSLVPSPTVTNITARGDLGHSVLSVLELSSNCALLDWQRAQGQRKENSNESKRSDDGNPVLLSTGDKPRFSNGADVECKLRIPSRRGTERKGDWRHHGPRHLYRAWNAEPASRRCRCTPRHVGKGLPPRP